MWAVYILLTLLVLLLVLLLIPITLWVIYDGKLQVRLRYIVPIRLDASFEEETKITVHVLKHCVWAYPSEEEDKPEKEKAEKDSKKQAKSKVKELMTELKSGDVLSTVGFLWEFLQLLHTESGKLLSRITVTRFRLQVRISTDEAAETAQLYGKVCAVLFPLLARLEQTMRVRHREVRVEPDFLSEKCDARLDMRLRLTLPRLIATVVAVVKGINQLSENK